MSLRQWFFNQVHQKQLIYNICWEDPLIDRELLAFNEQSRIAMITSAGCNALTYLLDNPKSIHCADLNYRQNAVLALKIALFKYSDHSTLFAFFGKGYHPNAAEIYHQSLRPHLKDSRYQRFWDQHINSIQNGTYLHSGSSGKIAAFIVRRLKRKKLYEACMDMIHELNREKREVLFNQIFPRLFPHRLQKLVNSSLTMSMLGVPLAQKNLIERDYGSVYAFISNALKQVFVEQQPMNNYFYRFYLEGKVDEQHAPAYLKADHFKLLRRRVDRIELHTLSLEAMMKSSKFPYTHVILLDHQDWMSFNEPELLDSEWDSILDATEEGSLFLLRSASIDRSFLPEWILPLLAFDDERTKKLQKQDRVGTYASTHLAQKVGSTVYA